MNKNVSISSNWGGEMCILIKTKGIVMGIYVE